MPDIHPEVQNLLSVLFESRLAVVAEAARSVIENDATPDTLSTSKEAQNRRQMIREQGIRQLGLVDQFIRGRLAGELEMTRSLSDIARELEITSIAVLPTEGSDYELMGGSIDHLLQQSRIDAIKKFMSAWASAVEYIRKRLEGGD